MSTMTPRRPHFPATDAPSPPGPGSLTTELVDTVRQSLQRLIDTFELNRIDLVATHGVIRSAAYDVGTRSAVHEALHHLETDRYGECRMCGGRIDVQRLRRVPYARRCSPCQQIEERRWNQIERAMASVVETHVGEPQGRLPVRSPEGRLSALPDSPKGDR